MENLLQLIFSSPTGSFAFVFGIMIAVGWLIYFVTHKTTKINMNHQTLSNSFHKIETHIDEIRKDLSYLKGNIDIIQQGNIPLVKSHSPISLTDEGNKIAIEINADEIIAKNWDKILSNLDQSTINKNAYDIQQYCMETASTNPNDFFCEADVNKIKLFAYQKGQILQYYMPIFAVKIRDKYFEIKKISTIEIDKHDPHKKNTPLP